MSLASFAAVLVDGLEGVKAHSDSTGSFKLNLPPGDYTLVFQHISFDTVRKVVVLAPAGTEIICHRMVINVLNLALDQALLAISGNEKACL